MYGLTVFFLIITYLLLVVVVLRMTLFSTRAVFDPSQYAGLPLNIIALMPVLVHHFIQPTEFCIKVVSKIQEVRWEMKDGVCEGRGGVVDSCVVRGGR